MFLRESKHADQPVNEFLRDLGSLGRGLLDKEWLVDDGIFHVVEEPSDSQVGTAVAGLVQSVFGSQLRHSHLHDLVEKFLV